MSEAREKIQRFIRHVVTIVGTTPADLLYDAIRAVIAENAAQKGNECSCSGLGSSPASSVLSSSQSDSPSGCSRKSAVQSSSPATAEAWVPTATQIGEIEMRYVGQPWSRRDAIRYAFIAGHRFKEESCSQSGSQLESWSSENSSSGLPTSTAGNRAAPTESASSSESVTRSIDARCEALFAKNEEWRPRSTISELRLINGIWFWWDKTNIREYVIPAVDTGTHLLAALLPRAIDKWNSNSNRGTWSPTQLLWWQSATHPPRDLESAVGVLEGA